MGSSMTLPASDINHYSEGDNACRASNENNSMIQLLLNSDRSTSGLYKFLERIGNECILTWYLDIREFSRVNADHILRTEDFKKLLVDHDMTLPNIQNLLDQSMFGNLSMKLWKL